MPEILLQKKDLKIVAGYWIIMKCKAGDFLCVIFFPKFCGGGQLENEKPVFKTGLFVMDEFGFN
jgi:hypothetical protein